MIDAENGSVPVNSEPASLATRAYAALKRDIIRCELKPGELVLEARLAQAYGMSKTPIRQALALLQTEGLVTVAPRRGTFVKTLDDTDVGDAFRLRLLLEPEAAVLASQRATAQDLRRLEHLSEVSSPGSDDPRDRHEANRLFHIGIAEAAHMRLLTQSLTALHHELERYLNYKMALGRQAERSTNHRDLVALIKAGDEPAIRDLVISGVQKAQEWMSQALIAGMNPRA